MPEILINVINKIPQLSGDVRQITADNSDYTIRFVFDDDWDDGGKTVFFVREGGFAYPVGLTEKDMVAVPAVRGVHMRTQLFVGVQQGDVKTSRPCMIPVYHAITDMIDDGAVQPEPSMWEGVVQRIMELESVKLSPVGADEGMTSPVGRTDDGRLMTSPDIFWARYGETKYAEVTDALATGKMCMLEESGEFAALIYHERRGGARNWCDFINERYPGSVSLYRLYSDDVWEMARYKNVTENDLTDFVEPGLVGKIPTAQATYEAIIKYGGGSGGGTGGGTSFETGNALELVDGVLGVKTTDEAEADNTLPITSAGVHAIVGNISAILDTI